MEITLFEGFNMCLAFIMVLITTYVSTKKFNNDILDKRWFAIIVAIAPILILISFGLGKWLSGSFLKYIPGLISVILWLLFKFSPDFVERLKPYNKPAARYMGLVMAILIVFLISGCGAAQSPSQHEKIDIDKRVQDSANNPTPKENAGPGIIR